MSLDYKVYGRDSIFIAEENAQMGGLFKKLKKKVSKIRGKIASKVIPKKLYKKIKKFGSKNRKKIKKLGAIAAIAVGGYFAGPAIMGYMKTLGASTLTKTAASKGIQAVVKKVVKKKMSPGQVEEMQEYAIKQAPGDVMYNPQIEAMMQEVATKMAGRDPAVRLLAQEGAAEISYQAQKRPMVNPQSIAASPGGDINKLIIPGAVAALTLLSRR